jgi:hypothetical protein
MAAIGELVTWQPWTVEMPESIDPRTNSRPESHLGALRAWSWAVSHRDREDAMASEAAWQELTRALRVIHGPQERASAAVRRGARRVAAEMQAAGVSPGDVRRVLTRLVAQLQGTPVEWEEAPALPAHSVLLADVLQSAIVDADRAQPLELVDERRVG